MRAGYLRRALSALIDLSLVILIVYLAFISLGRPILQNRVEHYDVINSNLQEVIDVKNANLESANNEEIEERNNQISVINHLSSLDQRVYDELLYDYYSNMISFYLIGISILLIIIVVALKGITPGRRLMRIELVGNVNTANIIIHDLLLKYIFIIGLIMFNLFYAFIIIPIYFILDLFLIILSKNKTTIRDNLSKITLNYKPKKSIENQF
ncbi:MAG: RDD family protein [Candidatus Izemoplasmatales bacterium]